MIIVCWRKFLLPRHKAEGKGRCLFVFFRGTHFLALSSCFLILQIRYAFVLAQSPRVRAYRFLRKPPEYLLRWSYYRLYAWLASYECAQRLCGSAGRWRSFHLYYERLFCSAGILKLISCQNGLKKVGISHPDLRVLSRVVFCRCLFFELSRTWSGSNEQNSHCWISGGMEQSHN